ncbi:MAG: Wzz/FepE/Etk N-terminal domain-containing protein, partial [Caulobacteraceae bacterium]
MVGDRDGASGSSVWAPTDGRRAVLRPQDNAVAVWEEAPFAEASDSGQAQRLLEYWRVVWKHKWVIAVALVVAMAAGLAITLLTPRIYTASTT